MRRWIYDDAQQTSDRPYRVVLEFEGDEDVVVADLLVALDVAKEAVEDFVFANTPTQTELVP